MVIFKCASSFFVVAVKLILWSAGQVYRLLFINTIILTMIKVTSKWRADLATFLSGSLKMAVLQVTPTKMLDWKHGDISKNK